MPPPAYSATWTAAQARTALHDAPACTLDALCPEGRLLVVAPHPDDESLGCGGLIALAAAAGRAVTVAVLTDGAASHPNSAAYPSKRLAALRAAELEQAVDLLSSGRATLARFDAGDGLLEHREAEAQAWLGALANDPSYATVFATWQADPHPDHKAAFRIAERQARGSGLPLYAYPVWGLTLPDEADAGPRCACMRLDVRAVLPLKAQAIAAHRSQTTALIDDDPKGFRLSPADVARHLGPYESFLACMPVRA